MKRFVMSALTVVVLVVSFLQIDEFAQRRGKKKKAKRGANACAVDLASCPAEGCSDHEFDTGLNRAKNRVTASATADVVDMTLDEIRDLDEPDEWTVNQDRSSIQGPGLEGQAVRVMGYLWKAKREGEESCNCGLDAEGIPGQLLTDIHIVMTSKPNSKETTSVTVEITPRVRAKRPNPETWDWSSIQTFNKKFIRVTGYLLLDTHHLISNPLKRATNWEVHPVMKLEVCTSTITKCKAGQGWANVK